MVSKVPVGLETAVKIMLQMISLNQAVVKVKPESFLPQLHIKRLVVKNRKPNIGFSLGVELTQGMVDRSLESDSSLFCEDISVDFKQVVMNKVISDNIVGVMIKLTPDVEIYLDGLGHVL